MPHGREVTAPGSLLAAVKDFQESTLQNSPLQKQTIQSHCFRPKSSCLAQISQVCDWFGQKTVEKYALIFAAVDHMLQAHWNTRDGWLAPEIVPYQTLNLDPATCVFHYAFECFEGMKAYKGKDGSIRLFRPDKNMARFNKSSKRIALPTIDSEAMIKLIGEFVKLDNRFIPA